MYVCPRRAARIAGIKWALMWDLRMYPNAPSAMHASTNCCSEWTVRNTVLADKADSRSRWAASIPLKTGIVISVTITSGQRRRASDTNVGHPLQFPLRQTEASKARLWLPVWPDGHPQVVPVVGSRFASVKCSGTPDVAALDSDAGHFNFGMILGQCAVFCCWGNP
jgi:hypothetical protein